MKMGEHPGNTGAGHLRCRGGGSNRRRNAIKDEERRRQEPSSYAEHARKHAHNAAKANNDKGIDRQIGDGKVKVHYSGPGTRSEEHTSELQSLMRNSYAAFRLKKKKKIKNTQHYSHTTTTRQPYSHTQKQK